MVGFSLFSLCSLVKGARARRELPWRSSRRRRPLKRWDVAAGSAAEPQTLDQRVVARDIRALQVIEQAAALADHHEQAASRMEILLMMAQMLGQIDDPL